jgi:hypothetical protein
MNLNRPATAWLFIVQAECRDLFDRLAPRLSGMARVILDRRQAPGRRTRVASVSMERRLGDRRRPVTTGPGAADIGYHLVYDADRAVSEADVRVPAVCVACGVVLTFEMPRFFEAPAHVHLDVTHPPDVRSVQHVVDLKAVSGTGRMLLACRLRATRIQGWEGRSPEVPWVSPVGAAYTPPVLQDGKATVAVIVPLQTPQAHQYAARIVAQGTDTRC